MLDLTPFDFTPTESLIYEVLVTKGPGTGYAVARAAGLARANAYAALEGLVGKGAARADDGPPKRYRPEPPAVLLGRIVDRQSQAIDQLARTLEQIVTPATTTLVEVTSLRSVGQLLTLEIARARTSVSAFLPASAWPMLVPSIRRAAGTGAGLSLFSDEPVRVDTVTIDVHSVTEEWPGRPVLAVVDDRIGLVASAEGDKVAGHWSAAPTMVAAARLCIGSLTT